MRPFMASDSPQAASSGRRDCVPPGGIYTDGCAMEWRTPGHLPIFISSLIVIQVKDRDEDRDKDLGIKSHAPFHPARAGPVATLNTETRNLASTLRCRSLGGMR